MRDKRTSVKGAQMEVAFLSLGRIGSALVQGILLFFLASMSTVWESAFLLAHFSLALFFSSLTDYGFNTLIVLEGRSDFARAKRVLGVNTAITFALMLLIALGSLLVMSLEIALNQPVFRLEIIGLYIWALLDRVTEAGTMYQLTRGHTLFASLNLVGRRLIAVLIFFSLTQFFDVTVAFVFSLLIGSSLGFFLSAKALAIPSKSDGWIFRELRSLGPINAANQIRYLDVPIVVSGAFPSQGAGYALGARFANLLQIVAGSFGTVLVARGWNRTNLIVRSIFWMGSAFSLLVVLAALVGSGSFVSLMALFLPWSNQAAASALLLSLARYVWIAVVTVFSSMLVSRGFSKFTLISTTSCTAASLFFLWGLSPSCGFEIASLASILAFVSLAVLMARKLNSQARGLDA
jgi:O-antigen/teichoic acid export membrane protein